MPITAPEHSFDSGDDPACFQGHGKQEAAKPYLLAVAAVLVDPDGRVLIACRPEGKSYAGYWEFPGGKIEPGETPEMALVRELEEELGIDTRESCLAPVTFASHPVDEHHVIIMIYVCRVWKGLPRPRDGQDLRWVHTARLRDYKFLEANLSMLPLIRDLL